MSDPDVLTETQLQQLSSAVKRAFDNDHGDYIPDWMQTGYAQIIASHRAQSARVAELEAALEKIHSAADHDVYDDILAIAYDALDKGDTR